MYPPELLFSADRQTKSVTYVLYLSGAQIIPLCQHVSLPKKYIHLLVQTSDLVQTDPNQTFFFVTGTVFVPLKAHGAFRNL